MCSVFCILFFPESFYTAYKTTVEMTRFIFKMVPKFDEFRSKLNVMMMQEVAILKCNHDQCILCHVESDIPASALEC